jgi:hypothetical protein
VNEHAEAFEREIQQAAAKPKPRPAFKKGELVFVRHYDWPGGVRGVIRKPPRSREPGWDTKNCALVDLGYGRVEPVSNVRIEKLDAETPSRLESPD